MTKQSHLKKFRLNTLLLVFMLAAGSVFAQKPSDAKKPENLLLSEDQLWKEGSIMLNDGTELNGLLKYNERTGILSYESGSISKSFIARSVVGFEFWDERMDKQRMFITFSFLDEKTDVERPHFFEVLKEFQNFAVISKIGFPDVSIEKITLGPGTEGNMTYPISSTTKTFVEVTEMICIIDSNGNIHPYLEFVDVNIDRLLFDRSKTKGKFLDESVLSKYTAPHYEMLEKYAKYNDLSFKKKDDLLRILEYYALLIK